MLKRLFKETLIYGLSRYLSKFIGVFLLPLYTAALMPEDYGILDLLTTISLISTFLIVSGTDSALSYYYFRKEFIGNRPIMISSALWLRIFFSLISFLLIFFASNFISEIIFGKDLSLFIIITGITLLFTSVYSFIMDLLRFELKPWLFTFISTASVLLNIGLTILYVLYLKQGVYGALMASAIAYAVVFIYTCIYVFKKYGMGISGKWIKDILKYGFPLIGTGIAAWILGSTDRYFLAHYHGLEINGIYAVGSKIGFFIGMVAGALQLAWGPFSMDIQYEKNAKNVYAKVFLLYFIVNIIGIFFISMFATDLLKVFTQPEYYSAKAVIPFLSFSTILSSAYFIVVIGMHLTKKLQHTIWITVLAAVLNIALNFLLTPAYGAIGAAFSIMCANLLIFILTLWISQKYYRINFNYSKVLAILIPSSGIILFAYYVEPKIIPRIIISAIFLVLATIYLYYNFRNSEEYLKLLKMLKLGNKGK